VETGERSNMAAVFMLGTCVETCKNYGRKGAKFAYVVCLKKQEKNVMKEIQCVSSRKRRTRI